MMNEFLENFNTEGIELMDVGSLTKEIERYGEKTSYLPLPYKKIWFKTKNPDGKIGFSTVSETDSSITVEARVYRDKNDDYENYIGIGIATICADSVASTMFVTPDARKGIMITTVRGSASSKALSDAGYGLQFYGDILDPEAEEAEKQKKDGTFETTTIPAPENEVSPKEEAASTSKVKKETKNSSKKEKEDKAKTDSLLAEKSLDNSSTSEVSEEDKVEESEDALLEQEETHSEKETLDENVLEDSSTSIEVQSEISTSNEFSENEESPLEDTSIQDDTNEEENKEQVVETVEDARKVIAGIGKMADLSLGELEIRNNQYLFWLLNNANVSDSIKQSVKTVLKNTDIVEIKEKIAYYKVQL